MGEKDKDKDLLSFIHYILNCEYLSDLRKDEKYNKKAKLLLRRLDLTHYSFNSIKDAFEYILNK